MSLYVKLTKSLALHFAVNITVLWGSKRDPSSRKCPSGGGFPFTPKNSDVNKDITPKASDLVNLTYKDIDHGPAIPTYDTRTHFHPSYQNILVELPIVTHQTDGKVCKCWTTPPTQDAGPRGLAHCWDRCPHVGYIHIDGHSRSSETGRLSRLFIYLLIYLFNTPDGSKQ